MNFLKIFLKNNQQTLVLIAAFVLVAGISYGLGQISAANRQAPEIKVEQVFTPIDNYTPNVSGAQTSTPPVAGTCDGRIKGSSSLIYHVPGGSFYDRTTKPIRCFDTETEAQAAGFRKSSR